MTRNVFLEVSDTGQSAWWRYVVGGCLCILVWFVLGTIVILIADPSVWKNKGVSAGGLQQFVALSLSFAPLTLSTILAVVILHKRKWFSLINPGLFFDWRKAGWGFLIWFVLCCLQQGVGYLLRPEEYAVTASPNVLFQLPLVVPLTTLQSSTEELFFRGYLLQGMSKLSRNTIVLCTLNALLFALPHLANPEILADLLVGFGAYCGIGFTLCLLTLRSQSLELAIGAHVANNLFAGSIVNYAGGTMGTQSLFLIRHADAKFELLSVCAVGVIGYYWAAKVGCFNDGVRTPSSRR